MELLGHWRRSILAVPGVEDVEVVFEAEVTPRPLPLSELLPALSDAGASAVGEHPAAGAPLAVEERPSISDGGPLELPRDAPRTLAEALTRAAAIPGVGLTYLAADGRGERFQPYDELLAAAESVLAGLRALGLEPGDPVIFQLDRHEDFLTAFWGAVLGGFLPVPAAIAPTYREANAGLARIESAWRLLGQPPILASAGLAADLAAAPGLADRPGLRVAVIDELRRQPRDFGWHPAAPEDPALLLLTSGSTGAPKAVIQTHQALLASSVGAIQMHGFGVDSVFLNWFPLDHVAGIVMFHVQPLYLGGRQIHGPMEAVLKRPEVWLEWIERHRATVTWAPNFVYGQVIDRAEEIHRRGFDLSSMRFILNGGEAIVPRTARRFMRLLAPYGLRADAMHPGWGMSETSGGVVFSKEFGPDTTSDDDSFVCLGRPFPGTALRIVDEADRVLPEPVIGRLQIRGPSITVGYLHNTAATAASRTADGWFDTGDLGFLHDGRLTLTGRSKETIIINGLNYHSHEIEHVVEECSGVVRSFTAACAVRRPGVDTDELAIFFSPQEDADLQATLRDLRERVMRGVGLRPACLVPLPPEQIPKSSIGKILRARLVEALAAGDFDELIASLESAAATDSLPDWFFRRAWVERPLVATAPAAGGPLLLFAPPGPRGAAMERRLEQLGLAATVVEAGDGFVRLAPGRYRVAAADAEDYRRLFAALAESGEAPRTIVHAWRDLAGAAEPADLEALRRAQAEGVLSVKNVVAALGGDPGRPLTLLVAASRAQEVEAGERVAFASSALPGLVRTVAVESPWLEVRLVDLAGDDAGREAEQLLGELAGDGEPEVAWRGGRRLVGRLAKVDLLAAPAGGSPFVRGGIYLVPGALGGIGLEVARFLVEEYDARILALGRTSLPPRQVWNARLAAGGTTAERIQAYRALEATGGGVEYSTAGITDLAALSQAVAAAEERWGGRLAGVVHLAGVNRERHWEDSHDHQVGRESAATFERLFEAKLYGTWTLYRLLAGRPEALFISMSSVLGDLAAAGHGAYAAASSFMAGCAAHHRATSHPRSYCLAWTMWDDLGMSRSSPQFVRDATRGQGFAILSPDQGLASLLAALHRGQGQVIVGLDATSPRIAWRLVGDDGAEGLVAYYSAGVELDEKALGDLEPPVGRGSRQRPRLHAVPRIPRRPWGAADRDALALLVAASGAAGDDEAASETERAMSEIWAQVLSVPAVSRDDRFFEVGGDSLKATQLLQRVAEAFEVDVPLRDFFDDPTVSGLVGQVEKLRGGSTLTDVASGGGPS